MDQQFASRDEAINAAAKWWVAQMRHGVWDNGDTHTEVAHHMFAMVPKPTDDQWPTIEQAVRVALQKDERNDMYSDYGCGEIDTEIKALGLPFATLMLGPQKAGTKIDHICDVWKVCATAGYGQPWLYI